MKKDADIEIERVLLKVDRNLWRTLENIKTICGEMSMQHIFSNPQFSDLCQEAIKNIKKEQRGIEDARKHKTDTPTFRWTV